MEFDLGEILRIANKAQALGRDALTDDELFLLAGFGAVAGRAAAGPTEQLRADTKEGFEIFERLPAEQQEKYADWTPAVSILTFNADGSLNTVTQNGNVFHFVLPGTGTIAMDVGTLVFDSEGNLLKIGGPHQFLMGDVAGFCAALADP